jgi:hypothetical protein
MDETVTMRSPLQMAEVARFSGLAMQRLAFFLLCGAIALACDRNDAVGHLPPEARTATPAGDRPATAEAGADFMQADPPALAGDLAAEIDGFTTLDACIERRSRLDPLVGDALEAIGYDTLLRDACRVLDAAKARDARRCDAIVASPLRERCVDTVAEITGTAETCPWRLPSRKALGRDPVCVALASRDPRLCTAVTEALARATCLAIARHDAASCDALSHGDDKARCARDAQRWASLLPAPSKGASAPFATAGKLTAMATAGDGGGPVEADLAYELQQGVVVVVEKGAVRVAVGPSGDLGFASSAARTALAFEATLSSGGPTANPRLHPEPDTGGSARVERAELTLAGRATLRSPPVSAALVAKVAKLDATRGGTLEVSLDGDVLGPEVTWHLHAEMTTFVRDVVAVEALYDVGRTPAAGDRPQH